MGWGRGQQAWYCLIVKHTWHNHQDQLDEYRMLVKKKKKEVLKVDWG